jgi:uncharacterized membrane protein
VSVLVLILSVSAACCLGFGFVLQQNAASHAPLSDFLSPRLLLDLIRVPRWLGGIGLMVCGMVLGAVALGKGEISQVEPLLATNLLFALALTRHQTKHPLGRQGWAGLVLVQSAFETAELRMSLPALTAAQPLAGIACGVGFLGDQLRTDAGALAWQAAGLAGVVAGIVLLGMHPAMPSGTAEPERSRDLQPH